jgi:hypothetical protein
MVKMKLIRSSYMILQYVVFLQSSDCDVTLVSHHQIYSDATILLSLLVQREYNSDSTM